MIAIALRSVTRPPAARPPGGLARVLHAAAVVASLGLPTRGAPAQVIRGMVKTQQSATVVSGARVSATDSTEKVLGETVSDAAGRFTLALATAGQHFRITVLKLGWQPSATDWIAAARTDTLELDFIVPAEAIALSPVDVKGEKSYNTRSLEEAQRHGWKVYDPDLIERHRANASTFVNLLREVGATSLRFDDRNRDCIRSIRQNRCIAFVIDGVPAGPSVNLMPDPRDIYFFAILTATESASQWGDKAPWGAVVIYTRMNGDRKKP